MRVGIVPGQHLELYDGSGIADAPVLAIPLDLSIDIALNDTLEWNAATGADSYTVEIATDNTFNNVVDTQTGLTGTSATPSGLLNSTTYYWRVSAVNTGGSSTSETGALLRFRPLLMFRP